MRRLARHASGRARRVHARAREHGDRTADGLSLDENDRLLRGDTVARPQDLQRWQRRYVGGVTYKILDASPDDLASLLDDVDAWRRFLPKTRDAHRVGAVGDRPARADHPRLGARAGRLHAARAPRRQRRALLDGPEPRAHDIEDVWGFFRAEPLGDGRTLVTYGILIDMGDGILRDMFEDRVREVALEVPDHVRDVVAERQARGRRAAR